MNKEIANNSTIHLLIDKIIFFQDVVQRTILNCQKNKLLEIINTNDTNLCIEKLFEINTKLILIKKNISDALKENKNEEFSSDGSIDELQIVANELSTIFKDYGTTNLEDLLKICFGNNTLEKIKNNNQNSDNNTNSNNNNELNEITEYEKYELLRSYFHPISYKVLVKKSSTTPKEENLQVFPQVFKKISIDNILIDENTQTFDCFDFHSDIKSFHLKLNGLKLYISCNEKIIIINGMMDDVVVEFMNNKYIDNKIRLLLTSQVFDDSNFIIFKNFIYSLKIKDFLINNLENLHNIFNGYQSNLNSMKNNTLSQNIKDFLFYDNYNKRRILIELLLDPKNNENIYLSYLLYDLLSNDTNGNIDSKDQVQIFDSFTWFIKKQFKHAVKKMIQYNNEITNYDINKIPLEQQICFLKVPLHVKEKALTKLKEIKSKGDDNGSKARQYLDGLLKIPFQIYKREPSLNYMNESRELFRNLLLKHEKKMVEWKITIPEKEKYTSIEILYNLQNILFFIQKEKRKWNEKVLQDFLLEGTKKTMDQRINKIKLIYDFYQEDLNKKDDINNVNIVNDINHVKNKKNLKKKIMESISSQIKLVDDVTIEKIMEVFKLSEVTGLNEINDFEKEKNDILNKFKNIKEYLKDVKSSLDKSIYGHEKAKKQIETIIAQWLNGEQYGYCFGFEGPPGVGKTSLAKYGLSECLKDENGISRPFSMIQMGGDSNGSTLQGHNYTYVGSTWGSIVQILIDKKCMNPIIFIDEVDKISKTEHGKEIVGILTHLLDTTQNDCFQDKYFSGIEFDLSKALFILSYNDVNAIDKILLDRIHRIKFNHLSLEDKLIIVNKHILPEIYKKVGLENTIFMNNSTLTHIIEEYTNESGVRKLKEILFEIIGDFNLNLLKKDCFNKINTNTTDSLILPIEITMEDIKTNYLKDKNEIKYKKIHGTHEIGIINGLWANSYGQGGVIPIQARFYPCDEFLHLKLTGMQGDVMKESMNVALTLAWNLTNAKRKEEIQQMYNHGKNQYGIHIHCPEGSTPKDGPSAGTAITTVLYSLLNDQSINYEIAITGEISLDGNITEIGGLDLKILGGLKAGVKKFIYPKENERDYNQFTEKYKEKETLENISFCSVDKIEEVFKLCFTS